MKDPHAELRAKLARAIEALILPHDPTAAIGDAAQHVVIPLMKATDIDETDSAPDRRLALDILTPRGNDSYHSHAAKLREAERQQAGLTLFRLHESMGRGPVNVAIRVASGIGDVTARSSRRG
jgi:hypothetical protein